MVLGPYLLWFWDHSYCGFWDHSYYGFGTIASMVLGLSSLVMRCLDPLGFMHAHVISRFRGA